MKRRRFFAAFAASLTVFFETAKAYVDPAGWHRHQCPKCGFIWTHTGGPGSSHTCTRCGGFQNVWYQGNLPPSGTVAPAPAPKAIPDVASFKF